MYKESIIKAGNREDGSAKTYLSEVINQLPHNSFLNKVTTGCGATTLALENDEKYVLCMPFVSLVKNKEKWCKDRGIDVLSIYSVEDGGSDYFDIESFEGNKIMVTYDSLGKVTQALNREAGEWRLFVDECHKLVDSAAFRPNAVHSVVSNYHLFKSYCFATATPVPQKYQLPALKNIPMTKIEWNNLSPVEVKYIQQKGSIVDAVCAICMRFIEDKEGRDVNAHMFINSLNIIQDALKKLTKAGYNTKDLARIVASKNSANGAKARVNGVRGVGISDVNSDVKKLNFYTSTAFEGCDIYDETGVSYIFTDGRINHTKIEISTILPQIIGRVRDAVNKNKITMVYTKDFNFTSQSEEEYEATIKHAIEGKRRSLASNLELKNDGFLDEWEEYKDKVASNSKYLIVDHANNNVILNENALYSEMFDYGRDKITYFVSKSGKTSGIIEGAANNNGIPYNYIKKDSVDITLIEKIKINKKADSIELCKRYIGLMKDGCFTGENMDIEKAEPWIAEAYEVLGAEKMGTLKYQKGNIKQELVKLDNKTKDMVKVNTVLRKSLIVGGKYTGKEMKAALQEAFDYCDIKEKATAAKACEYMTLNATTKTVNGKRERAVLVVSNDIKVKEIK